VIQALIVYAIVALATAWTVWRLFLRGWFKRRASARSAASCGPDCACGD
jgi:hypothetical protein